MHTYKLKSKRAAHCAQGLSPRLTVRCTHVFSELKQVHDSAKRIPIRFAFPQAAQNAPLQTWRRTWRRLCARNGPGVVCLEASKFAPMHLGAVAPKTPVGEVASVEIYLNLPTRPRTKRYFAHTVIGQHHDLVVVRRRVYHAWHSASTRRWRQLDASILRVRCKHPGKHSWHRQDRTP